MKNPEKQLVGRNDISMRKNSKMIAILDYKIIMNFIFSKILKILRYKDFLDNPVSKILLNNSFFFIMK